MAPSWSHSIQLRVTWELRQMVVRCSLSLNCTRHGIKCMTQQEMVRITHTIHAVMNILASLIHFMISCPKRINLQKPRMHTCGHWESNLLRDLMLETGSIHSCRCFRLQISRPMWVDASMEYRSRVRNWEQTKLWSLVANLSTPFNCNCFRLTRYPRGLVTCSPSFVQISLSLSVPIYKS